MTIQGHRIPAEVDREMKSLLWVLILKGLKHVIGTLASEDHVWFEDRWMVASLCDE
jgi:hypothetical protein